MAIANSLLREPTSLVIPCVPWRFIASIIPLTVKGWIALGCGAVQALAEAVVATLQITYTFVDSQKMTDGDSMVAVDFGDQRSFKLLYILSNFSLYIYSNSGHYSEHDGFDICLVLFRQAHTYFLYITYSLVPRMEEVE